MAEFAIKKEKSDEDTLRKSYEVKEQQTPKYGSINYRLKQDYKQQTPIIASSRKGNNGLAKKFDHTPMTRLDAEQMNNSSKCGLIYVCQKGRKWTFVCSFCKKKTRDIGEFVCHVKFKHMGAHYDDDEEDNDEDNGNDSEKDQNAAMDYFDCTNYLDVNVHTEEDDQGYRSQLTTNVPVTNGNDIVNLLEEDEDETNHGTQPLDYEYEPREEEDESSVHVEDNDNSNRLMEDEYNHLLKRRSSQDEESNNGDISGGGSIKKYRSHVRGTAYCKLCDKTFQYYSLYRNHMIKHSNVTPYKCQFCQKGFKSKQALRYHMKTHTKEKEFQCPLCPTTYATSSLFMAHVLSHESDSCFPCMVCAKVLTTEREREQHLESHAEDRPHGCNFCGKRFRQKHHLSNHLKLHCQYRCDFCRESFTSTQTQRRPYACPSCEESPDIRQQVEMQRSYALKQPTIGAPPMEFENVTITNEAVQESECVDLEEMPSDDDSDSENTSTPVSTSSKKYPQCNYCRKTFAHISALNMHIRQEHSN
ncbi:uncharacterized protein LOC142232164 [Haematobia irritans]|uniref:uncharacterized protein LOC142232164 n=1 Tax=Haematobia irritans TaxID=7368 RepID=UPI003F4F5A2C